MDQNAKQETRGSVADFFDFWDKSLSSWQKNMFKFSEDFAEKCKALFMKSSQDNFFSAYQNLCKEVMEKSVQWQGGSPVDELFKKTADAANMYSQMLKSFAIFDAKPGENMVENLQTFVDNWVGIQKNLFSNLFGGSLPPAFAAGGDLSKILGASFDSYKDSLQSMLAYFPQEVKPLVENYIDVLKKSASAFDGVSDPSKFRAFHDSWQNAYDEMVGKFLKTPAIGPSRQFLDKLKKDADSFFKYLSASAEFYTTLYKPGLEAIEDTAKKATETFKDVTPDSFRKFYDFLLKNLEMKFFELFKSKGFGEALKTTLDASLEFRTRHFDMLETMLKETPLVTHTEMDEVHEEVYKLKKRIKELEKTIKDLKAAKAK